MTAFEGVDRRTVLASAGSVTLGAFAGCVGTDDEESDDGNGDEPTDGSTEEPDHDLPARGVLYGVTADSIVAVDPADQEVVEIGDLPNEIANDLFVGPDYLYAVDSRLDQVHAVDLDDAVVETTVDVSGGPVHGFYDETTERAYVHADVEATLYGIDGTDPDGVESTIELTDSGHGKVAATGDGRVFVTNGSDGGVFVADLEEETVDHLTFDDHEHSSLSTDRERDDSVQLLHDDGDGTHFIQYAPESDLVFVEQLGGTGGDETIVVDASNGDVVERFDVAGPLYLSADDELLAIVDGDDVHLVDATTDDPDILASVPVGDEPRVVRFTDEYVLTMNTDSGDVSFVDRTEFEEVDRLSVSDELEDVAPIGDGRLVTVDGDTVSAIDIDDREVEFEVEIPGLGLVQYVPEDRTVVADGRY